MNERFPFEHRFWLEFSTIPNEWRMEQPFRGFWENWLTLQGAPKFSKIYFREFWEFLPG